MESYDLQTEQGQIGNHFMLCTIPTQEPVIRILKEEVFKINHQIQLRIKLKMKLYI